MKGKKRAMPRKISLCAGRGCNNQATTLGYCRLCYLKNWKRIRTESKKKAARNLNKYIDSVIRSNREDRVQTLKDSIQQGEPNHERSLEDMIHHDSVRDVMSDLGYREDLDIMIDSIRIDEDF
jgi:hypothetical protein